jgi:hypothetical protein
LITYLCLVVAVVQQVVVAVVVYAHARVNR